MKVNVRNVSKTKSIVEVEMSNGDTKEIVVEQTEFGYSYNDFSDWDISDKNYYDLENLVDQLGNKIIGVKSSLDISWSQE